MTKRHTIGTFLTAAMSSTLGISTAFKQGQGLVKKKKDIWNSALTLPTALECLSFIYKWNC